MPILHRDFETRSTADLKKVGAWRYATHPDTDVLCCAYAVDDGPVSLWVPGDPVPPEWIDAASDLSLFVSAHNDNFERQIEAHIMGPRYGWPTIPIERHRCTMAAALALALPAGLDKVAAALGLEQQKDDAGKRNMQIVTRPRKPLEGEAPGVYWVDDPARLNRLYAYCKQDVETERALHVRIGSLPPAEQAVWVLDAAINDRGIFIDNRLALGAVNIDRAAHRALDAELQAVTSYEVMSVNQTEKLIGWLSAHGCPVDNIQKETIRHALTRKDISNETRRVLELRRDGAHAASGKFETMMDWRSHDGRARGCFRYHGASTGRWTSIGLQVQNLKRTPPGVDMLEAIAAIRTGDIDTLRKLHPNNPLAIVGDVARGALCAAPGRQLVIADFSGIEGRVLAWLADERREIEQWAKFDRTGNPEDEPYFITGAASGLDRDGGKTETLAFGYMGGVGAFRKLAPNSTASDEQIKRYQRTWRRDHPATVKFWGDINRAAIDAVQHPGKVFAVNPRVSFIYTGNFLRMRLPSGRELAYPFPLLHTTERGDLTVIYKDNAAGKWVDCKHHGQLGSWPGGWTENVVQAVARDLFAAAMPRLEAAGYPIVLHVHDEIVAEVPEGFGGKEELIRIITEPPDWAEGLPIAAKGDVRERFCKTAKPREPHDPATEIPAEPVNTCEPSHTTENGAREPVTTDDGFGDTKDNTMFNRDGYPESEGCGERPGRGPSFTYLDERCRPYLRVTRTVTAEGKKIFPQQHWENGQWAKGAPTPKIPYRLPELIAAPLSEPVFICEGEKDACSVAALGLVATSNPGGGIPKAWTSDLNKWFTGRTVFICEDHDKTGRNHANEVASALKGIATEIRIVEFHELPEHGDVSDYFEYGGTAAQLLARAKDGRVPGYRFKLVPSDAISINTTPAYLVKDILPRIGLAVVWGPPKCGKSFLVFDLMMHVALGWMFRDLKVKQGAVVYCALEGGGAFRNRHEAFRRKKLEDHVGPVPFFLMASPLALIEDHPALIASIHDQCPAPAAVTIDTLNRSLTGSESSDEDMGSYIKAADAISAAFECLVVIVHHCGYEGTRPRGHSSLIGALDAQIGVMRDAENNIIATVEYLKDGKDGPEGAKLISRLEVVELGADDDGDLITSCVVAPVTPAGGSSENAPRAWDKKAKPPKGAAKIAHEALFEAIGDHGVIPPADPHIPAGRRCARLSDWKTQAYRKGICATNNEKSKETAFRRVAAALVGEHMVGIWDEFAWVISV